MRAHERGEVLRVTLASIGDAVITTDLEGRVTYLNAAAETLTGWTTTEAVGRPLDQVCTIVNEDTRAPVANPATRALREGVTVGLAKHTVLIRRGGGECPIDDSAAPIRGDDGAISGSVLIFRDVSAQRHIDRVRARQLHTDRLLASIVETSDDAIISKSLDGVIQSWNAAAERMFGYSAAEAVGRHISLVIPAERLAEEDEIIADLKAGQRVDHFETERVRSDGQRLAVSLTVSPIKNEAGHVVGASKIVRDVTERKRLEETCANWLRTCPMSTAVRTSSSRRSRTSCEIRWRPSSTCSRWSSAPAATARRCAGPTTPWAVSSVSWSGSWTISWISIASLTTASNCAAPTSSWLRCSIRRSKPRGR